MNLKLRFALLFTSFVAGILLITCASIYFLYASYREEDYYSRVELEGEDLYKIYQSLSAKKRIVTQNDVLEVHRIALINERLFVLDSNQSLIFSLGVGSGVDVPKIDYAKVRNKGKLKLIDSVQNQIVAIYKPEKNAYLITEAYDRVGLKKVYTMSIILLGAFSGSLLLTAVISFLFVKQAIKPIVELSNQMQRTNVFNLSERITVKPARDEINAIAKNFNAMLERIRTGFEYRKSFVQQSSHELRTPLAVMLSQTEAALNNVNDVEGFRKVLLSLKEDQQHLIELTNALLQISQNEQLEFVDNWPSLRVDELLYDTVAYFNKSFPDGKIDISYNHLPDDDRELMVKGNESLLRSAFINLIKNAYLYSIDKTVQIIIYTGNQQLSIVFQNKGKQIKSDEVAKIFLPFFRGANAESKKGFGLGLGIIERIIQIHKGKLSYRAEGENLNQFSIEFPIGFFA
ncbi:MAG: hypothetical protein RI983_1089 [Bacteroidota bacterium]|jgi:signal transduction histidine kinase